MIRYFASTRGLHTASILLLFVVGGCNACPETGKTSDCPPCEKVATASPSEIPIDNNSPDFATNAEDIRPILPGMTLPPMTLLDGSGKPIDLNNAIASQNTVLLFFRGGWCPYCNAQLSQLKTVEKEITDHGFQIIAISADKPDTMRDHAQTNELDYKVLSDSKMTASKALGIAFRVSDDTYNRYVNEYKLDLEEMSGEPHHLLPVPAVFVVDKTGLVTFSYVNPNYKTRLDPNVLLAAVKALQK